MNVMLPALDCQCTITQSSELEALHQQCIGETYCDGIHEKIRQFFQSVIDFVHHIERNCLAFCQSGCTLAMNIDTNHVVGIGVPR